MSRRWIVGGVWSVLGLAVLGGGAAVVLTDGVDCPDDPVEAGRNVEEVLRSMTPRVDEERRIAVSTSCRDGDGVYAEMRVPQGDFPFAEWESSVRSRGWVRDSNTGSVERWVDGSGRYELLVRGGGSSIVVQVATPAS